MGKLSRALEKSVETGESPGPQVERGYHQPEQLAFAREEPLGSPAMATGPSENYRIQPVNTEWDERLRQSTAITSLAAESFRKLRAEILYSSSGHPIKSIMITSCAAGEGKGFVTANLGVSIAQGLEQHALIVDCDLRRPTISSLFGVGNNQGLSNFLQEDIDPARIIKETGQPKLAIIPSGPPPKNPSELLESRRMVHLLEEISTRYHDRFIILDSPPLGLAAEASVLVKYIDAVVLVVRWGVPDRIELKRLIDAIGKQKIVGVIFNAVPRNFLDRVFGSKRYYTYYGGKY